MSPGGLGSQSTAGKGTVPEHGRKGNHHCWTFRRILESIRAKGVFNKGMIKDVFPFAV